MAKVPAPGRAKTRLIPRLGPEGAARLARAMAEDVLATALTTGLPVRVAVDGDLADPWVATLPDAEPQAPGDLGARLAWALRDGGVAIGTDAPLLPAALLLAAHHARADVRLAPAADGGYVLVGATAAAVARGLFRDVPWSTDHTFAAQRARALALGLSVAVLAPHADVDRPEDLPWLAAALAELPASVAPATRAALAALGVGPPAPARGPR